jgi:hypothetical protein
MQESGVVENLGSSRVHPGVGYGWVTVALTNGRRNRFVNE